MFFRAQNRRAKLPAIGHVDTLDRSGSFLDGVPKFYSLEYLAAAVGESDGSLVVAGRGRHPRRGRFDDGNANILLSESAGQGAAHQAAAHN